MADRQTGSVWTHYDGSILTGPLTNQDIRLEIQPIIHTTWSEWLALYPQTTVLDWYPEFEGRYRQIEPGRGGLGPQFQATVLNWDDRLAQNELVLGVSLGTEYRAYVLEDFDPGYQLVEDTLNGKSIVVFLDTGSDFGLAFVAALEGDLLHFTSTGEGFVDDRGNLWGLDGAAISGPDAGAQLPFATSFITEWYGWAAYHPQTGIYGR